MQEFEDYLEKIYNPSQQQKLKEIFEWIQQNFPHLKPRISWNQPMYTDHETFIIGFSCSKHHFSIAPETKTMKYFSQNINASGYQQSSHLFKIRWNDPIDFSLLKKIIEYNIEDKKDCSTFWRK